MTEDTNENPSFLATLFSRENLMIAGAFLVIFVITALLANQTINDTLQQDTTSDVFGDVEDIGDEVYDELETIQEDTDDVLGGISATSDVEAFLAAVNSTFDEDVRAFVETIGLYQANADALILRFEQITIQDDDGDEEIEWQASAVDDATVPAGLADLSLEGDDTFWHVGEEGVQYIAPLQTEDDSVAFVYANVTRETLTALLTEGAVGEDLFLDTQSGYALLMTADNTVLAQYNQSASSDQASAILGTLTEENFDEDNDVYTVEDDALIGESTLIATLESDFNEWIVVGAFPTSETPSQSLVDSTVNLFDASELGDTISLMVADAFTFLNEDAGWIFRGFKDAIQGVIDAFESVLLSTHWSIVIFATTVVAAFSGGRRVATLSLFCMFIIGLLGLWDDTMTTLAMLLTSMAFCIVVGIPIGILASRNDRVNEIVRSVLDAMQTIHPFVYLVPIAILFGIGTVPGTIATIIFALPPMVRLTNLGIRQVPEDVIEAAKSFGSNDWQLLRDVQIPLAMPSIMAGVNQTLMLSLSMVVIVALIAGGGLGQEIYNAIQNQNIGRAVVAGTVVLLLAVVIDRISQSGSNPRQTAE
jgi:glycine betaine/proline transport system permease protein